MEIYPAVDLYEGKVVRLERGDYEKRKVYSDDPGAAAIRWADEGTRWLHVIDLEGARSGRIQNWEALKKILEEKRVLVQFGGGVRRLEDAEKLFEMGIQRVIVGTKILDFDFLKNLPTNRRKNFILSLDLRGDEIQTEGWLSGSGQSVFEIFKKLGPLSFACAVVTDISRDGTLKGIDLTKIRQLLDASPFPLILSGGIGSIKDIQMLASVRSSKLNGVIIGKALYEERVNLREALQMVSVQ